MLYAFLVILITFICVQWGRCSHKSDFNCEVDGGKLCENVMMVALNGSCITALETCISFCQGVAVWQAKAGPKCRNQGDARG